MKNQHTVIDDDIETWFTDLGLPDISVIDILGKVKAMYPYWTW